MTLQKFGATASIIGDYVEDYSKIWINDDEMWPARRPSEADLVLQDDELIDAKKLVPHLTFIENKEKWGVYLQGSIRQIPEEDFRFIESEMKKIIAERKQLAEPPKAPNESKKKTEKDYEAAIMRLPLEAKTLHDRLCGAWGSNLQNSIKHKEVSSIKKLAYSKCRMRSSEFTLSIRSLSQCVNH